MTPRKKIGTLVAGIAVVAGVLTVAPGAQADTTVTIPGSAPNWLARASTLGIAAASGTVAATIDLAPKGGTAALDSFVAAVSSPASPGFRKFLTRSEYAERFQPTDATVGSVSRAMKTAGLTVTGVAADNSTISISGTVAQADRVFGAAMKRYRHDGQSVVAPSHALRVPAAMAAVIAGVRGLDTTVVNMKPAATNVAPPAGFRNSTECSTTYGTKPATKTAKGTVLPKFQGKTVPFSICGYTGAQLRTAYEKGSALTGSGAGIAIVDAYNSPTIASDASKYASGNGDPAYGSGQLVQYDASSYTDTDSCGASGWFGEQTLDIEAAHAMAPGAKLLYFAATSCSNDDLLAAITRAVANPGTDIVSGSFGSSSELLSTTSGYEAQFKKAASIGVTMMFSSGDDGDSDATVGFKTVGYPASSPNVTAVGGTATAIGSTGAITATNGWGTNKYALSSDHKSWTSAGYQYGAGGGTSRVFSKPSYQSSIAGGGRQVPDIAMNADPTTGMLIGQTQTFTTGVAYGEFRIGGTSLASPLLAGFVALAVQQNGPVGFINPAIYANPTYLTDVKDAFPDTGDVRADYVNGENASGGTTYTIRTFGDDSSLPVKSGYDNVTGLGVPKLAFLTVAK